jgi:hypothetical protein
MVSAATSNQDHHGVLLGGQSAAPPSDRFPGGLQIAPAAEAKASRSFDL